MASYQIPQFLDSGDKIFGPMNIRQLAYMLGGFLLSVLIYSVVGSAVPGIGPYAAIPAAPTMLLAAFLALGRYNGRDSEVYVLKIIIYFTKPRLMKYRRQPEYRDIEAKSSEWTEAKILARWNAAVAETAAITEHGLNFQLSDKAGKVAQIRAMSRQVDIPSSTVLAGVREREIQIERQRHDIRQASSKNRQNDPDVQDVNLVKKVDSDFANPNFFDSQK